MKIKLSLPLFLAIMAFSGTISAQLQVADATMPPYDSLPLLVRHFLTGDGIELVDVKYEGVSNSSGFFTTGGTVVNLDRGLLMTTGRVITQNPFKGVDATGIDFANWNNQFNVPDSVIQPLLNNISHYNRSTFIIKFKSVGDSVRFRYVFGSEEYPEYGCSAYNDIFGFFLSGPQPGSATPYQNFNIALIPGTNLPVAINNVHPQNPNNGNCPPLNDQYYNANSPNSQPVYDGFTNVFIAEAAVIPCAEYTIRLTIADVGDAAFDSGVFLEANSFYSKPLLTMGFEPGVNIIPENATAIPTQIQLNNIPPQQMPLQISLGGSATFGADYTVNIPAGPITDPNALLEFIFQPVSDTLSEGIETIEVTISGNGCLNQTLLLYLADADSLTTDSIIVVNQFLENQPVMLDAYPTYLGKMEWTFAQQQPQTLITGGNFSPPLEISGLPLVKLDDINVLSSVRLNITHEWTSDLAVFLKAPGGRFLELTSGNGGNGDNYLNTIFTPFASQSITNGTAPFTSSFQPEGLWSDLKGSPLNGEWELVLTDGVSGFNGMLLNWDLTFKGINFGGYRYLWSTGDTTPSISVTQPGIYNVRIENQVSFVEKTFSVKPPGPYSQLTLTTCPGDTVVYNGVTFSASHPVDTFTYTSTFTGEDSLVYVNLAFFPTQTDTLWVFLDEGEAFTYGGQTLSETGVYSFNFVNQYGCDSTAVVNLTILVSTENLADAAQVKILPQPVHDHTTILLDPAYAFNILYIYAENGQLLMQQSLNSGAGSFMLDMSQQIPGRYFLVLEGQKGRAIRMILRM